MAETQSIKASWKQSIFGWIISAVTTIALAFGTSYFQVRADLGDVKKDVQTLQRDSGSLKTEQDKFVTKDVQAETNRAVIEGVNKLDNRLSRIEDTQTQILMRLPAREK
jgi:hypothetical protein